MKITTRLSLFLSGAVCAGLYIWFITVPSPLLRLFDVSVADSLVRLESRGYSYWDIQDANEFGFRIQLALSEKADALSRDEVDSLLVDFRNLHSFQEQSRWSDFVIKLENTRIWPWSYGGVLEKSTWKRWYYLFLTPYAVARQMLLLSFAVSCIALCSCFAPIVFSHKDRYLASLGDLPAVEFQDRVADHLRDIQFGLTRTLTATLSILIKTSIIITLMVFFFTAIFASVGLVLWGISSALEPGTRLADVVYGLLLAFFLLVYWCLFIFIVMIASGYVSFFYVFLPSLCSRSRVAIAQAYVSALRGLPWYS